jgi:hypothetical protein
VTVERRNPYLVLGLPFGASRDEAVRAFARRTKFLRRLGPAGRARHTDLTGALHELETAPPEPATRMAPYRIPADPAVAGLTADGLFGPGVFAPPPETLDEAPDTADLRRSAAFEYLRLVVRARGQRLGPPAP